MPAIVPVTGYPSDYRTPSIGVEIVFAQGESISGAGSREILVVGPIITGTGTYTAATVYGPVKTEAEVSTGAGPGSALHRMVRKIMQCNKGCSVYVLPVAETVAGSPVKATGTFAISGTATASFNLTFSVGEDEMSVYVKSGDIAATVATAMRAVINARTWLSVTAGGTVGDVVATCKHFGTRGGNGTYDPIQLRCPAPGNGITVAVTQVGATTAGAEGSTTEAAQVATALQSVEGRHFYYYAYDNFGNATALANFKTHLANKALPRYGRRSYLISGYNGTLAAFTTIANGLNYERIECALQINGLNTPETLCGQLVASVQKIRETDPANGMINYAGAEWVLKEAETANWPDEDDTNDAIAAGASLVRSKTGGTYLAMSLTTRSKDSSGTHADFRAAESHRISVADYCAAELTSAVAPRIGDGFKAHPALPSGLPDPNALIPRGVSTPFTLTPTFKRYINAWETSGLTQNSAASVAGLVVVKSPINAGRLESGFPLYARDNLSQITCRIAEASAA